VKALEVVSHQEPLKRVVNAMANNVHDPSELAEMLRNEQVRSQRELETCRLRMGELEQGEALLAGESRLLELIARGSGVASVLDALGRFGEKRSDNVWVSILLVSPGRKSLRHGAAASLTKGYTPAIDGGLMGPRSGACGTAAYRGERVIKHNR